MEFGRFARLRIKNFITSNDYDQLNSCIYRLGNLTSNETNKINSFIKQLQEKINAVKEYNS